uniref:ABC transporter domain-containing protein n=1 Tax=Macrostomum lignano TaxID=282301 RepID=A0A1I8J045_9PLAT
ETYGIQVYGSFLALALDGVVYFLVGWYFRNVLPGKHGVPQSPLFFLTARYWGCDSSRKKSDTSSAAGAVVELKNVNKKFGSKQAVQNLNLKLQENETTILLGPNGAGKSTTINMITGLISCDSGKITVNGLNVSTSFYKLRSSIGFCPQHNVYYDDLSVKQNLAYFGALKGCSKSELEDMLRWLRLYKVRNVAVQKLSGGQKRRLSIGLAFLGKPSLVILDEPTASVDPDARRTIWELIKAHRCTTLICTHDMQEAEILGDHVAVMKETAASQSYQNLFENCRYTINISSESPQALAEELSAQNLNTSEPAINERHKKVQLTCPKEGRVMASLTYSLDRLKTAKQFVTCPIFGKRFHHAKRSWISYIGMLILPCVFIVFTMGSTLLRPSFSQESAKLLLTPTIYGPGAVTFLYQDAGFLPMKEAVRSSLARPPGIGTVCMPGENRGKTPFFTAPCKETTSQLPKLAKYATYRNCSCDKSSHYECVDEYSKGTPPDVLVTPSGDVIHELRETTNLNDLLLRSTARFNLSGPRSVSIAPAANQRWGGLELQSNSSVIWFDNRGGYHTLPSYLNAYSNTMLRMFVATSNYSNYSSDYGISTYNHPLPMQRSQLNTETFDLAIKDAGLAMCIVFALCFVPASISLTVSNERFSGEQVHLRLYGVGIPTYWLTSFVWDILMYLLPLGIVIGIMAAFQIDLYTANLNLPAIAMLSSPVRNVRNPTELPILRELYRQRADLADLTYVFMALPSFSLGNGVFQVVENQWKASILKSYGASEYADPFTMAMVGPHAIAMGRRLRALFLLINILIDIRCRGRNRQARLSYLTDGGSDVGVQEEFDRVNSGACRQDPIQLTGLGMTFRTVRGFRIHALDNLTMSVAEGTCLGLLGPNGSGKSTTFNILTRQLNGYSGYCSIEGLSYCPQSNPLDKEMTVTETLVFYARLLGLSSKDQDVQLEQLISALRLPPNKVTKALSG